MWLYKKNNFLIYYYLGLKRRERKLIVWFEGEKVVCPKSYAWKRILSKKSESESELYKP